ncbi:MAG: 4Fe-4S binding protein [Candidatus Thalassarchaeum sp.]
MGVGHDYILLTPASVVVRQEGHIFVVDDDRCFGCAACVALCPVDALTLQGLLVVVDEPSCTHCNLCIPSCPVFALDIIQKEELEMII